MMAPSETAFSRFTDGKRVLHMTTSILYFQDHLGPKGDNFVSLSQEAKDSVGDRLRHLLDKVVGGAMVPLLNCTLSNDDVKKLSSLKFNKNVGEESIPQKHEKMLLNPVKQEYDDREDIAMANIGQDISNWRQEEGIDNKENGSSDQLHVSSIDSLSLAPFPESSS